MKGPEVGFDTVLDLTQAATERTFEGPELARLIERHTELYDEATTVLSDYCGADVEDLPSSTAQTDYIDRSGIVSGLCLQRSSHRGVDIVVVIASPDGTPERHSLYSLYDDRPARDIVGQIVDGPHTNEMLRLLRGHRDDLGKQYPDLKVLADARRKLAKTEARASR